MLRVFAEVARAGNLVSAAEVLGRTPSAVSMSLKTLEDHLGQPLFEGERKNRLTPLGGFTLEMAERELAHYARTVRALEDFASARTGEVRIAAVPSFATSVLPAIALAFVREHPHVRVDIRDMDSATILRELDRERIDLGIVSDARPSGDLQRTRLGADAFGIVVRADSPFAGKGRIAWRELAGTVLLANPLCERVDVPELHAALAGSPLRVHNTTTLLAMVRGGLGVTVLPELVTRDAPPDVSFVRAEEPVVRRELHLVSRLRDRPSPATGAFAAFLAARAAREFGPCE